MRPMPLRLGHLRLDVEDLDAVLPFYTDVVGLVVHERATDETSHYAFLSDGAPVSGAPDGMHHRIVLRQARQPGEALGETTRLDHVAFEVESPADLLAAIERLRGAGAEVDLQEAGIAWQCYTRDPEGVRVEIYCDRRDAEGGRPLWLGVQEELSEARVRAAARA